MKNYLIVVSLMLTAFTIQSCKDDTVVQTSSELPAIEESSSYNEAYRDSIIAIDYYGVCIVHKSGGGTRTLISGEYYSATWSPNKWKILYASPSTIFVMNPDGSQPKPIYTQRDIIRQVIVSPDGRTIAYISIDKDDSTQSRGRISIIRPDGSENRSVLSISPIPSRLSWMPDSKHIVYNNHLVGIFQVSIDDSTTEKIYSARHPGTCCYPCVSRDGKGLAFSEYDGKSNKIFIMDLRSKGIYQLTEGNSYDSAPSWSVDGTSIVYERSEYSPGSGSWGGPFLWTIGISGQNNTRLNWGLDSWEPCWQQ